VRSLCLSVSVVLICAKWLSSIREPQSHRVTEEAPTNVEMDKEEQTRGVNHDLDPEQARLAYSIISSLLEHTRVVSDLIATMAQVLDEDTTKALTQTPVWTAYLESRRALERTKEDVESFTEVMKKLSNRQ
jgi:hypothetical protein